MRTIPISVNFDRQGLRRRAQGSGCPSPHAGRGAPDCGGPRGAGGGLRAVTRGDAGRGSKPLTAPPYPSVRIPPRRAIVFLFLSHPSMCHVSEQLHMAHDGCERNKKKSFADLSWQGPVSGLRPTFVFSSDSRKLEKFFWILRHLLPADPRVQGSGFRVQGSGV